MRDTVFYGQDGKIISDQRQRHLNNSICVEELEDFISISEKYGAETEQGTEYINVIFYDVPENGFCDYVTEMTKALLKAVPQSGILRKLYLIFASENGGRMNIRLCMSGTDSHYAGCKIDGISDADPEQIREIVTHSGLFEESATDNDSFWSVEIY